MTEAITIMRGVWGTEPFTFAGDHFRTTGARVTPPPRQRPGPPLLIAGGGERVTLRQVAEFADACQLGSFEMVSGAGTAAGVRRKLAVLDAHCAAIGRPPGTVLRTHFTGWLVLAEDEDRLRAKTRRYFPDGIEHRFGGAWFGFAIASTVDQAITLYRELAAAGIQYFFIELLDAADEETIRLVAERVIPAVREA